MDKNYESSKKPLSLKVAVGYRNIVWGLSFICLALSSMVGSKPLSLVFSVISLLGTMLAFNGLIQKKECEDEMYQKHIGKASEFTLSVSILVFVIVGLFAGPVSKYLTLEQVIYFGLGFSTIMQGSMFLILEK